MTQPDNSDILAERALLGYLINNPKALTIVKPVIAKLDYFTAQAHRTVYSTLLDLEQDRETREWDEIIIGSRLKERGKLKDVGGHGYLAELAEAGPGECNIVYYAMILRAAYLSDKTRIYLRNLSERIGGSEEQGMDDAIDEGINYLKSLQVKLSPRKNKILRLSEIVPQVFSEMEQTVKTGVSNYLSTGFEELDKVFGGGLARGEFNVLAGRPGTGKTSLAVNIVENCSPGTKILFVSLEATGKALTINRVLPLASGIPSTTLRRPERMTREEWEKLYASSMKFKEYTGYKICEQSAMTISELESMIDLEINGEGLDFVVLDYFQRLRVGSNRKRWEEFTEFSTRLADVIKSKNLFNLTLSQLNRDLEKQKRRPRMSDLADSSQLEKDAFTITFLHYESDEAGSPVTCTIGKNRNGPTDDVELHFNKARARFESVREEF